MNAPTRTLIGSWLATVALLVGFSLSPCARADTLIKRIEYRVDGQSFVGSLIFDTQATGRRPGVLVADERGATSPEAKTRAAQIARLGYVVMTVDLYGKNITPSDPAQALHLAGLDATDRKPARDRTQAALQTLLKQAGVDRKQIAAVGYGIGGTALVDLARTGVDLEGVVCMHGPVLPPLPEDKAEVQPTFLILTGDQDPQTPIDQIDRFVEEMKKVKIDVKVLVAKGETHAPGAASLKQWEEKIDAYLADEIPLHVAVQPGQVSGKPAVAVAAGEVPQKVLDVLKYVDEHGEAMDGYEGGRTFGNYEHRLGATDPSGKRIKYREWDVNPHRDGVNRGVERLITGSDGSAWFTNDHYQTFKKIR